MTDQAIEQELQAKGRAKGPHVTPADIEANISAETYFTAAQGWNGEALDSAGGGLRYPKEGPLNRVTVCVLLLRNGFTATGVNECNLNPDNFCPEVGRTAARQKALDQIWPMMGYALKERLAKGE